ncbi:hypothetical protein HU200_035739 [Digitaria exilis]|uniref:CCHC-type domain-containing protein n=1 Tax=Digitaria exilis TaxID=1010633 RepID=A0A835BIL2_9POAL|nr:hypothetical protein HU200_035739 [Digitaria exilis]
MEKNSARTGKEPWRGFVRVTGLILLRTLWVSDNPGGSQRTLAPEPEPEPDLRAGGISLSCWLWKLKTRFILSSHPRAMNRKPSSPVKESFLSLLLLLLPLLQISLPIAGAARTPPARADPARDIGAIRFLGSVYTRLLAQNCYVFTDVRFTVLETPPPSNDYTAPRLLPARLRRTDRTASTDLPASNLYDYFEQGQSRNIMSSDDIPPAGNGATNAPGRGKPEQCTSEQGSAFEVKDNLFRGCILGVIAPHLINPLLKKKTGKEMWDALDAQYGVSDAGSELYLMEQFLDYRMVEDRPVVEQANELHVLAKDLGCCNKENPCVLPDKFVAGGIISKLPPSWRDFATSLKHRRQEFTIDGLIGTLDVEEKARAKDVRNKGTLVGASANFVQKNINARTNNKGKGKKPPQPQNPGKAKQTTGFKKKKGACYVCGSEDHFAGKCPQRKEGKSANMVISEPAGTSGFILSSHPRAMNRKPSSPVKESFLSLLLLLLPLLQISLPIAGAARTPPARADPARDIGAIRFLGSVYTRLLAQNCYVFTDVRFTVLETPPPSNDYTAPRLLPARLRRTDRTASTDLPASNLYDYFEQGQSRNIMSSDDIPPAGNGATNAPGRGKLTLRRRRKDATTDFEDIGHSNSAKELMPQYCIGYVYVVVRRPTSSTQTVFVDLFPSGFASAQTSNIAKDRSPNRRSRAATTFPTAASHSAAAVAAEHHLTSLPGVRRRPPRPPPLEPSGSLKISGERAVDGSGRQWLHFTKWFNLHTGCGGDQAVKGMLYIQVPRPVGATPAGAGSGGSSDNESGKRRMKAMVTARTSAASRLWCGRGERTAPAEAARQGTEQAPAGGPLVLNVLLTVVFSYVLSDANVLEP